MKGLVKRSDKKAFYATIGTGSSFTRMKYFTELSTSKNPKEYSRSYIDEDFERTDVTGYSPSMSFSFDEHTDDPVLSDIIEIIDNELVGKDAHRFIVLVDFSKQSTGGYEAVMREFAIIADSEGNGTDTYTYSGNMKAVGEIVRGIAEIETPSDGTPSTVETITFTPA